MKILALILSLFCLNASAETLYYEDLVEKLRYLPLDTAFPYHKYVLYSVFLPEIKKGDLIYITNEFEATNDTLINLMIASEIKLCDSSQDIDGVILAQNNGFNISPMMHHGVTVHARIYKASDNYTNKYINVIIWTASSAANSYDTVKIEDHYGHLDAVIVR